MPVRHDSITPIRPTPGRPPSDNPESASPLQVAAANRVRLVLSLLDQRADGEPGFWLSHPVVADGLAAFLPRGIGTTNHSGISRLIRGHRRITLDFVIALTQWSAQSFGLRVDPGWMAFGNATGGEPPVLPSDCVLREDTALDGLTRSLRSLRQIRAAERSRRTKHA